jgi:DNA polymerase III delta prime subunit
MSIFENEINKREHSLWVEKYRPQILADYVGNETVKETIAQYLDTNDIPHLLFYGKAGTGKTTLAKLIVNTIKCDWMIINASDENNVDTVRNKVKNFASSVGFAGFKVIILDEFDYMTPNAQAILRNLMETFSKHCRFILTCNYIEKIIDPIQSRCQSFAITPPTKKDVAVQVAKILDTEGVKYDLKNVADIITSYYPDIRRVINTCQLQSVKGELKVDKQIMVESDFKTKLIELLKAKDDKRNTFLNIRQAVADNKLNDYSEMYTMLYDKVDEYASGNTANVILTIADGVSKDALVVDKEIIFMATIIQILNIIK